MPVKADDRLTLFEHLGELRKRLTICIVAVAAGILVSAIFNGFVLDALLRPLRQIEGLAPQTYQITTFSPAEPFMVSLKVWVAGGLILASPILIWQLWAYVAPAFTASERRFFYPVVIASTVLFLTGIALAYFLVLPRGLSFLLNFSSGYFNVQNRANEYFTFMALFILAFGVVFELPVLLGLLAKVGVIDDRFLRKNRRYALLILALAAAFITPSQDAFSMLAMLIPLYGLYEASILVAKIVQPKKSGAARSVPAES